MTGMRKAFDERVAGLEIDSFLQRVTELSHEDEILGEAVREATSVSRPEYHPLAWRIARGLRCHPRDLQRVPAPVEALGQTLGTAMYTVHVDDLELAIREDGLEAFVLTSDMAADELRQRLDRLGFVNVELAPPDNPRGWRRIAAGRAPRTARCARIDILQSPENSPLDRGGLADTSLQLRALLTRPDLDQIRIPGLRPTLANPGQVIARTSGARNGGAGVDVFGQEIPPACQNEDQTLQAGLHVESGPDGSFRAQTFGFLCLDGTTLSVLPPVWLSDDLLRAKWVCFAGPPWPLSCDDLAACLEDAGVSSGIDEDRLQRLARQIAAGELESGLHDVAVGTAPRHGADAIVDILVPSSAEETDEQRWDTPDVADDCQVTEDQILARRVRAAPGRPGMDVLGRALAPDKGNDHPLEAGSNVRIQREGRRQQFIATAAGTARVEGNVLHVRPILRIHGDVSFSTGNLEFDGDIIVDGSVVPGFSVVAAGDIIIGESVEAGANLQAGRDLHVGRQIVGRRTRVVARRNVICPMIEEATVSAGRDIRLNISARNAHLRAAGSITIRRGSDPNSGCAMGGDCWALRTIDMHLAGAPNRVSTDLVVGLGPRHARNLDELTQNIERAHKQITRLLRRFGLTEVDLDQIRHLIAASKGPKRRILAHGARQLGVVASTYRELLLRRQKLERCIGSTAEDAEIIIHGKAFPGVAVRVGQLEDTVEDEMESMRFRVTDGSLCREPALTAAV